MAIITSGGPWLCLNVVCTHLPSGSQPFSRMQTLMLPTDIDSPPPGLNCEAAGIGVEVALMVKAHIGNICHAPSYNRFMTRGWVVKFMFHEHGQVNFHIADVFTGGVPGACL